MATILKRLVVSSKQSEIMDEMRKFKKKKSKGKTKKMKKMSNSGEPMLLQTHTETQMKGEMAKKHTRKKENQ